MKYSLFDVVVLNEEISSDGLQAGTIGTVVDVFTKPDEAYLVEFCDPEGRTLALLALLPNQIYPWFIESVKEDHENSR